MFKASLGSTAKIITFLTAGFICFLGLLFIFFFIISLLSGNFEKRDVMMPIIALGIFGILHYIYTQRTIGYEILSEGIKVFKANSSELLIKKETILEIKSIDYQRIKGSVRNFGIGGMFGFTGTFSNKEFGEMSWFITRTDRLLMIKTLKQTIILSPNDVQLFLTKSTEIIK